MQAHTLTRTHTRSHSLTHGHACRQAHILSHTHTHTHTLIHNHTYRDSLAKQCSYTKSCDKCLCAVGNHRNRGGIHSSGCLRLGFSDSSLSTNHGHIRFPQAPPFIESVVLFTVFSSVLPWSSVVVAKPALYCVFTNHCGPYTSCNLRKTLWRVHDREGTQQSLTTYSHFW